MKKKRIPGRPGGYFQSHPVYRKQTFFLVLPNILCKGYGDDTSMPREDGYFGSLVKRVLFVSRQFRPKDLAFSVRELQVKAEQDVSISNVNHTVTTTVNVEIFAQYIFSRVVSYARKYDVSENLNHYRLDRIRYKMRENMSTRKGHIWLDARKFSCAKISTFTVTH